MARIALSCVAMLLLWRIVAVNAWTYGESNRPLLRVPAEGPERKPALKTELGFNPGSPSVLVALGAELERGGDAPGAARAFAAALEVAPIDRAALLAAVRFDAQAGRVSEAVGRIDRLLTYYPDLREPLFATLVQWLPSAEGRAALEALAHKPSSWMGHFLASSCSRVDPSLAASLLGRRVAAGLAGREEIRCGIEGLRRQGHWDAAYQLWLNSLPRDRAGDVGYVFNGGFEHVPTGIGFDWIVDDRSPVHNVDFAAGSAVAGRRALRVSWTGKRITGPAVQQYLALPPGRYELSGQARVEKLQSVRGVQWTLRCAQEPHQPLGASPRFLGSADWERFAFPFEVPGGCAGQRLQLEAVGMSEGTTYVAGNAWFDELRVTRAN